MTSPSPYLLSAVATQYVAQLAMVRRRTAKPLVVGMIGVVGSGKSTVAAVLAKKIGAVIIRGDDIRLFLRRRKMDFKHTEAVARRAAVHALARGANVVIDSDCGPVAKRRLVLQLARSARARVAWVRTWGAPDVIIGRIITTTPSAVSRQLFGGAATVWRGSPAATSAVVRMREFWRRTPWHYRWVATNGGAWISKKLPIRLAGDINTTSSQWRKELARCIQILLHD